MKVLLVKQWGSFPAGACLEIGGDAEALALIANGTATEVDQLTPCRLNPVGYNGCQPPNATEVAVPRSPRKPPIDVPD